MNLASIKQNIKNIFHADTLYLPESKFKLADNQPLTAAEYERVARICDIFSAIKQAAGQELIAPPTGGVFWDKAKPGMGPFDLYTRKNRDEINHLFLLYNAFRDFCALAYEYDDQTPTPDYYARRYLRLTHAVPSHWHVKIPARLGELGWNVNGYPVNRWTTINQDRINAIAIAGITTYLEAQAAPKILEIGGGAAEMGYALCKALPNATWYDADLLGCLIYGAIHLAVNMPEKALYIYTGHLQLAGDLDASMLICDAEQASNLENALVFIPHFLLDDFNDRLKLHYAYNTYSFGEMPKSSVLHYVKLLDNFLKERGILYEQNGYFPERGGDNPVNVIASRFQRLPWPKYFNSRMLPHGAARVWGNNDISKQMRRLISDEEVLNIVDSLYDHGDKLDIHYQNETLWPRVYELFFSTQRVQELYSWATCS